MTTPLACACVLATAALAAPVAAQSTPMPCQAPEQRQFDFWIGRWNVFDRAGKKVGENLIEAIDDGCALLEHWRGEGGFRGSSLNSWSAETRRWHQHWVDNQGGLLRLSGGRDGARMLLSSREPHPEKAGATLQQRIAWIPLSDGAVRQWWEQSDDDGATWRTVFDGRYVRQP